MLGWPKFARQNKLTFKPDNFWLMRTAHVTGIYCGYDLRLETIARKKETRDLYPDKHIYTRMILRVNHSITSISSQQKEQAAMREYDTEKVVNLLMPAGGQQPVKGNYFAYKNGREIVYEQEHIVGDEKYLQVVLDSLKNLIEVYPQLVKLGGEVTSGLLPIAKKFHPLQQVAAQLLAEIGKDTGKRLKHRRSDLLCSFCLIHCGPHQIITPWTGSITFYGCQACGQSRELISTENYRLIMILDNTSMTTRSQNKNVIRVNWMNSRRLFDFDEVEIIHATDKDVEGFAVQVGNDTDPVRRRRYKQMRCMVRSASLSENTMRILRHAFGQVAELAA